MSEPGKQAEKDLRKLRNIVQHAKNIRKDYFTNCSFPDLDEKLYLLYTIAESNNLLYSNIGELVSKIKVGVNLQMLVNFQRYCQGIKNFLQFIANNLFEFWQNINISRQYLPNTYSSFEHMVLIYKIEIFSRFLELLIKDFDLGHLKALNHITEELCFRMFGNLDIIMYGNHRCSFRGNQDPTYTVNFTTQYNNYVFVSEYWNGE